jgi:hypothetical protein
MADDEQTGGSGDQDTTDDQGGEGGLPDTVDEEIVIYEERNRQGPVETKVVQPDESK